MDRMNGSPWLPVEMVFRTASEGPASPTLSPAADSELAAASGDAEGGTVDPAKVAERVFRMMQRDLRLERERRQGSGGRRCR